MTAATSPPFTVIGAPDIQRYLEQNRESCLETVRAAYLAHGLGRSQLPHSTFLRLPDHARDRIIGLPGYLGDDFDVAGIKWISSWPGNTAAGLPRASALLVLNDPATGFPFACLESSLISATRTAASAVLAAQELAGGRVPIRLGLVGTGLIADHVRLFFRDLGWPLTGATLFDLSPAAAASFGERMSADGVTDVRVADEVGEVFADCDVVVLATVAAEPHLRDPDLLSSKPIVLHLSLRDLSPELVLTAQNITDDIDHVLRERTSLDLAEQLAGHREFVHGTVADLVTGDLVRDPDRAAVFSPFGLGVLDLAIGKRVHDFVVDAGGGERIDGFFAGADAR